MNLRRYVPSICITAGVLLLGAVAFAGPGKAPSGAGGAAAIAAGAATQGLEKAAGKAAEAAAEALARAESVADPLAHIGRADGVTETVGEGHDVENHGRCVSFWVHKARAEGLRGEAFGEFVSSIAENEAAVAPKLAAGDTPPATCDFGDELAEALDDQEASPSTAPGQSGQGRGRGPSDRPGRPAQGS